MPQIDFFFMWNCPNQPLAKNDIIAIYSKLALKHENASDNNYWNVFLLQFFNPFSFFLVAKYLKKKTDLNKSVKEALKIILLP